MNRIVPFLVFAVLGFGLWYFILEPMSDLFARERFANETECYLANVEPKIVRATLEWAKRENCLRREDVGYLTDKIEAHKPEPHCKLCRSSRDWTMLGFEIRQAMQNHARDRIEAAGGDRHRVEDCELRQYLPADWAKYEQLYEAHFCIARCWDRPSRPLAHLKAEFYDLKRQLNQILKNLDIR